jgi:predicted transcriptional regulator
LAGADLTVEISDRMVSQVELILERFAFHTMETVSGAGRTLGPLERSVMQVLWSVEEALTPAQVLAEIDGDPAYTTIMTVLVRLFAKGAVTREKSGRAYAYRSALAEADFAAERLREVLDSSSDRMATMSRFVAGLGKGEADALRAALEGLEG